MVFLNSCINQTNNDAQVFKMPKIFNSAHCDSLSVSLHSTKYISESDPIFAGKYPFQDSVDINPELYEVFDNKDMMWEYFYSKDGDNLDINGFELMLDYSQSVPFSPFSKTPNIEELKQYYPVCLVNSSNSDKVLLGKGSRIFGIQEANEEGRYFDWHPIEARAYDFCGNGRWGLVVYPNEFALFLLKKYDGEFETELRVRIQNGPTTLVSKPFLGRINKNQTFVNDSSYINQVLCDRNGQDISWLFGGAQIDNSKWNKKK